jgi:hypothetical protein
MPTKAELEHMGPTELAVLCSKIAESPTATSAEADQARDLKFDWAKLMTPPSSSFQEQETKEAEIEKWKRKAVSFLSVMLPE